MHEQSVHQELICSLCYYRKAVAVISETKHCFIFNFTDHREFCQYLNTLSQNLQITEADENLIFVLTDLLKKGNCLKCSAVCTMKSALGVWAAAPQTWDQWQLNIFLKYAWPMPLAVGSWIWSTHDCTSQKTWIAVWGSYKPLWTTMRACKEEVLTLISQLIVFIQCHSLLFHILYI